MSPERSSAQVRFDWIKPGSYAVYELSTLFLVKLNETSYWYYLSSEDLRELYPEATIAHYGFEILEVEDGYALLRVWLNESIVLPRIFNTSSLSCLVWVDIETRDLVDRETGEVWGKCPFWIYPDEAGRKDVVALTDFLGKRIVWDNITIWSEWAKSHGVKEASLDRTPIGYFSWFDHIYADFYAEETLFTADSLSFGFILGYNYHVEKGLLLYASYYADDILIKKFGIIMSDGSLYWYYPVEEGYRSATMMICDTNILRGREKKRDEWSPIPLAIAAVAIIPVVYYISLRRRLKRS
ncbi:MAG: hypothetical protein QW385_05175 [Thermoproteota archaeon]